ncbi:hypothetical protein PG991_000883 [Apiospora marii]|uniref:RING-type domain-containing protein n=1 Tax=Apiospora marii TaxID=335849 RepID=A0ABR1STK0_9PEZI
MFSPKRLRNWLRGAARRLRGAEHPQSTSDKAEGKLDADDTMTTGPEKGEPQNGNTLAKQSIYLSGSDNSSNAPEQHNEKHTVPPQETSPTANHPDESESSFYSDSDETVVDTTLTCRICTEPQPPASFPPPPLLTAQCDHPARTCRACIQTWLQTQLLARPDPSDWTHLVCPECPAPLAPSDVQRYAAPEMLAQYRAGVQEQPAATVKQGEDAKRSVGEGQRQRRMQEAREAERARLVEQKRAREREEARRQKPAGLWLRWRQDRASWRTIWETTRECPNPLCKVRIEKAGGW